MAAGGQEGEEQEPKDLDLGGVAIDAALFTEPEARVRLEPAAVQPGPRPRTWIDTTQHTSRIEIGVRYVLRPVAKKPLTSGRWGRAARDERPVSQSSA